MDHNIERDSFTVWLYNRALEAAISPYLDLKNRHYHLVLTEALERHAESNFQGRGMASRRRHAHSYAKSLRKLSTAKRSERPEYTGYEGLSLKKRDEDWWERRLKEVSEDADTKISILGQDTELKALKVLFRAIRSFDQLKPLAMTSLDESYVIAAINNLLHVLNTNGYQISFDTNLKQKLVKTEQ